jgi:hypothetical protein
MRVEDTIFGYFDDPGDQAPTFDPGLGVPCPFCLRPVGKDGIKTISLMPIEGNRSYFYRAHKGCYEQVSPDDIARLESSLIDTVVVPQGPSGGER